MSQMKKYLVAVSESKLTEANAECKKSGRIYASWYKRYASLVQSIRTIKARLKSGQREGLEGLLISALHHQLKALKREVHKIHWQVCKCRGLYKVACRKRDRIEYELSVIQSASAFELSAFCALKAVK